MRHQRPAKAISKKVRRAYAALFADSLEYNDLHLQFLENRRNKFFGDFYG